jgi:hypothetical protein
MAFSSFCDYFLLLIPARAYLDEIFPVLHHATAHFRT